MRELSVLLLLSYYLGHKKKLFKHVLWSIKVIDGLKIRLNDKLSKWLSLLSLEVPFLPSKDIICPCNIYCCYLFECDYHGSMTNDLINDPL